MKILYTAFDRFPAPKGAAVRIEQMLQALNTWPDTQTEVRAVLLGEPGAEAWEARADGIQIQRLCEPDESFLSRSVRFAEAVLETLVDWQPDRVQYRSLWDAFPLLRYCQQMPAQARPRLIYELHGLPEFELEHHFPELSANLLEKVRAQQRYVLQHSNGILCPSPVHRDYLLAQGIAAHKIGLVPNGVDTQIFTPGPERPESELPVILYIGTLAPWQGLEALLEALQWVQAPFRLRIVGSGQRRWQQTLLTKAFQLKLSHAIELLDPLPHELMPALIQEADLTVAPLDDSERNRVQGCMPLKILEYMACGKAVLAGDLPVTRHLLQHAETGWLYDLDQPEALKSGLETLLSQPTLRAQLGQAARERAVAEFSWQASHRALWAFHGKNLAK